MKLMMIGFGFAEVVLLFLVVPSFLIAWLIGKKRKIGFGFSLLACLLTGPLIGLIITLISKKKV